MANTITGKIKQAAAGKWPEIISTVGGIDGELLDGRNHPCPKCGGKDRFRMIDKADGALFCNQCFNEKNGDGLAAIVWLRDCDFPMALKLVAEHVGGGGGRNGKPKGKIVKTYDYRDEKGKLLFQVCRMVPKDFRQRQPKPGGGWEWSVKNVRQVPYRLDLLAKADPKETVFVSEGEKDVDRLIELGLAATCNAGGAEKWKKCHADCVAACPVVILEDNDDSGKKHTWQVAASLISKATSVKIIELPGLPEKGDISDWLDAGHTVDELLELVEATEPVTPEQVEEWGETTAHKTADITNATFVPGFDDGKEVAVPIPMDAVIGKIFAATGNWPRRVGGSLFVDDDDIQWLERPPALFGYLARKNGVIRWHRATGCPSKEETFAELQRTATAYEAIETMPHCPAIGNHYYACTTPEPGDGKTLDELLGFYCPATDLDRQLLRAMFTTPLWGGPAGTRPAFLLTCQEGRGRGKSTLAQHVGRLYGDVIDFSQKEDIGIIKQRLLTAETALKRVALLDNLKTTRFSWAELESLITADVINGKRMYVGDASRPNLLTWVVTLNGASLSTDMAQRVVEIRLGEPNYTGGWEGESTSFIEANREKIYADIIGLLQREPKTLKRLSRWATWESQVLARVDDPNACLDLIINRRGEVDVEREEGEIIEDYFAQKLSGLGYDPQRADVFISNVTVAMWYNAATGDRKRTTGVTRTLKQLHDERTIWRLQPYREGGSGERGFRWVGEHADATDPVSYDLRRRIANQLGPRNGNDGNTGKIDNNEF